MQYKVLLRNGKSTLLSQEPQITAKAGAKVVAAVRVAAKTRHSHQIFLKLVWTSEGLWPELFVLAECSFDLEPVFVAHTSIHWAACALL